MISNFTGCYSPNYSPIPTQIEYTIITKKLRGTVTSVQLMQLFAGCISGCYPLIAKNITHCSLNRWEFYLLKHVLRAERKIIGLQIQPIKLKQRRGQEIWMCRENT